MIRKHHEMPTEERAHMRGGNGVIRFRHAFRPEEFSARCRLCATLTIPPGASIGRHEHQNEDEIYLVLKGSGWLDDGTNRTRIGPGDAVLTGRGGAHAVINDGTEPLEIFAVILLCS